MRPHLRRRHVGQSPLMLLNLLNARGVPAPRGGAKGWTAGVVMSASTHDLACDHDQPGPGAGDEARGDERG